MEMSVPQIVAFGGGGFSMEAGNTLMDDHVLRITQKARPKVCFIPTASGDADHYVVRFYRTFAPRADVSHVSLFRRDTGSGAVEGDLEAHLMQQDLIYVGGGSVLSLLGAWRAHRLDAILQRAWLGGTVLCGLSAGSLCWFKEAVTAFHGPPERLDGLGLLPYSNCVHYDGEPERRAEFKAFIAAGMSTGYGVDDGAALHFKGTELFDVVASRPKAGAYQVKLIDGQVAETALSARYLGMAAPALAA
ncbi:MAG: peptidase dipeptidase [Solirubrobacterales bacterium]|nr:peptidase dipeptidase [Solirubrobacterales bacterium]